MDKAVRLAHVRPKRGRRGTHARAGREPGALQRVPRGGAVLGASLGAAGRDVDVFFLACVLVAGLYGGATASRSILVVQALPGLVALLLVLAGL